MDNDATAGDEVDPAEEAKAEIESGTHQLETLLNAAIDKNFDVFELYVMQNILTVHPKDQPYVRLSHYRNLENMKSSVHQAVSCGPVALSSRYMTGLVNGR